MIVRTGKRDCAHTSSARLLVAAVCCALLLCLAATACLAAGQAPATLPLGQTTGKQQTAPARKKAAAPQKNAASAPKPNNNGAAAQKNAPAPKAAGLKGFSSNPFSLNYRDRPDTREKPDRKRLHYGAKQANVKPLTLDEQKKLSVSAKSTAPSDDRLKPHRGVFPGASNTLSRMDIESPPEVNMDYRLNSNATTRLTVNPQDEESPLPRPAEQDGGVNSAGVYMKVDVAPDVQLKVGGEYCDLNDPRSSSSGSSTGASIGLKWDF